jgi:hypothetical protein
MPAGRIWIEVAVSEPSLLLLPVTVTLVPSVKSAAEPEVDLRIIVVGESKTISVEDPFCCFIAMLPLLVDTIEPAVKPPAAPTPPRAPPRPAKPAAPPAPAAKLPRAGVAVEAIDLPA